MTPDLIKTTVQDIVDDLDAVQTLAAGIDPALLPFVAIGRAIEKQLPGLAAGVAGWIEGNPPTPEETATLVQQLGVLGDPNAP
jgi:hypothetical protein